MKELSSAEIRQMFLDFLLQRGTKSSPQKI